MITIVLTSVTVAMRFLMVKNTTETILIHGK